MSLVNRKCIIGGLVCDVWIVEVEKDKFMYGGHAIAEFLGYKNTRDALSRHVKPQWKNTWEVVAKRDTLVTPSAEAQIPANWQPNTVFINEAGVYALIMRSKLPTAEEFQRWLFEEVLPELRKTGKYNIGNNQASTTEIVNYDKQLADAQMKTLQLKLELVEANNIIVKHNLQIAEYNTTISEMKRNYEHQMSEYRERELKMQNQMNELANAANITMTQFAVNALLAKDNIEQNEQMRQTLANVSNRVVPEMTEQPHKEEYITGYERMVNGKRRIRMCRSQLHEIEQQDKAIQRYQDPNAAKRFKPSKRYAWLRDSEKFLNLKCPNPVMVWLKVRAKHPHVFYGLKYTNALKTEMEVLEEPELRNKYRANMKMCERNKTIHSKLIEEFKALDLKDEDDCVARCLTPSVDAKERINTIVENLVANMSKKMMPTDAQRNHENASDVYNVQQLVHTMNNCQNYFVKNIFNVKLYNLSPPAIENAQ